MNVKEMQILITELLQRIKIIIATIDEILSHFSSNKRANRQSASSLWSSKTQQVFYSENLIKMEPDKLEFVRAIGLYDFIVTQQYNKLLRTISDPTIDISNTIADINTYRNILTDRNVRMVAVSQSTENLFLDKAYLNKLQLNKPDKNIMFLAAKEVIDFQQLSDIIIKIKEVLSLLNKVYTIDMSELEIFDVRKGSFELDVVVNVDVANVLAQLLRFALLVLSIKIGSATNLKGIVSFGSALLEELEKNRVNYVEEKTNEHARQFLETIDITPDGEKINAVKIAINTLNYVVVKYNTTINVQVAEKLENDKAKELAEANNFISETMISLKLDDMNDDMKLLAYDKKVEDAED